MSPKVPKSKCFFFGNIKIKLHTAPVLWPNEEVDKDQAIPFCHDLRAHISRLSWSDDHSFNKAHSQLNSPEAWTNSPFNYAIKMGHFSPPTNPLLPVLFITLFSISAVVYGQSACQGGWTQANGKCYKVRGLQKLHDVPIFSWSTTSIIRTICKASRGPPPKPIVDDLQSKMETTMGI